MSYARRGQAARKTAPKGQSDELGMILIGRGQKTKSGLPKLWLSDYHLKRFNQAPGLNLVFVENNNKKRPEENNGREDADYLIYVSLDEAAKRGVDLSGLQKKK